MCDLLLYASTVFGMLSQLLGATESVHAWVLSQGSGEGVKSLAPYPQSQCRLFLSHLELYLKTVWTLLPVSLEHSTLQNVRQRVL